VEHHRGHLSVIYAMLFHETDLMRFQKGHDRRRINLTFLFGHVGQTCVPGYFESRESEVGSERGKTLPFGTCVAGSGTCAKD